MLKRVTVLLTAMALFASAQTFRTETIDGVNTFTAQETLDNIGGVTFYATWDATFFYVAISGVDLSAGNTWWVIGDVDQTDGSGASAGPTGSQVIFNNSKNSIYEPEFALEISTTTAQIHSFAGTWGVPVTLTSVGGATAGNSSYLEASIPWAAAPTAEVGISSFVIDITNTMTEAFPVQNLSADYPELGWVYEFFNLGSPMPVAGYNPVNADNSLPVSLKGFSAIPADNQVELVWTTASEVNNQGFIVERALAADGVFREVASYRNYPALVGQGNSNAETTYRFTDPFVVNGVRYAYRLVDVDANGHFGYGEAMDVTPNIQGIDLNISDVVVNSFRLYDNFPNPFNPETTIRFDVPADRLEGLQDLNLAIFNSAGQKVRTLYNGQIAEGQYTLKWNGRNDLGVAQPSGIYFLLFSTPYYSRTQRLVLMK